jgi:hypothetical protein
LNNAKDIVQVYRARGELEAQIIKGLLESAGIPALLQSNAAISIHSFIMDGMGEVKVMVAVKQGEEARRIIEANADV